MDREAAMSAARKAAEEALRRWDAASTAYDQHAAGSLAVMALREMLAEPVATWGATLRPDGTIRVSAEPPASPAASDEVRDAATEALAVLTDLAESAAYWSDYDVPLGIVSRVDFAKARLAAVLAAQDGIRRLEARLAEAEARALDLESRLSGLLYRLTRGLYSKPGYSVDQMESFVDEAYQKVYDDDTADIKESLRAATDRLSELERHACAK